MSSNNIAERLGLTDEVKELKIGKSFGKGGDTCFHTFRYDFKPASVDPKKMATVDIGEGNQVTVTVPHVDKGSGSTHTVFKGSKKPYQKECVLIVDHETGEIKLEKLDFNVQLKKFRAEGSSKIKAITIDNIGLPPPSSRKSPVQKHSPQQKCNWSSSHYSPVPKCSPLPKSPNSQSSPPSQSSPSVPSIVPPPVSNATNLRHFAQVPPQDNDDDDDDDDDENNVLVPVSDGDIEMLAAELGDVVNSSSSGDDSSSSSSSESESSDEETVVPNRMLDKPENSDYSPQRDLPNGTMNFSKPVNRPIVNKFDSQPSVNGLPNMPQFSQLSQDLELSESDSDE